MKTKKTPERMCVVCKNMFPKNELIRVVRTNEGEYFVDTTGRMNGRGAYICKNDSCISMCFKKRYLNKAFRTEIKEEVYARLNEAYEQLKQN